MSTTAITPTQYISLRELAESYFVDEDDLSLAMERAGLTNRSGEPAVDLLESGIAKLVFSMDETDEDGFEFRWDQRRVKALLSPFGITVPRSPITEPTHALKLLRKASVMLYLSFGVFGTHKEVVSLVRAIRRVTNDDVVLPSRRDVERAQDASQRAMFIRHATLGLPRKFKIEFEASYLACRSALLCLSNEIASRKTGQAIRYSMHESKLGHRQNIGAGI